jgi:hypothetical protein
MKETDQISSLTAALARRVTSLSELHARGVVTGELLGKQLLKLLCSPDARKLSQHSIEPDSKALRILYRLEHPEGWRRKSGLNRDERLADLLVDLEAITGSDISPEDKLQSMLSIACLPFFKGFVNPRGSPGGKESKPSSRVSVLD